MENKVQNGGFAGHFPTWCPGCGNFGIWAALKTAFTNLGFTPENLAVIFGIGCSGNMNDFLWADSFHALHGRAIPNAVGVKIANHRLPVVAIVGDGDCYGEGGNHLVHACRGNHDITIVVHDNRVYGLTTGQVAPTAAKGFKAKSTPSGIIEVPMNPIALAITQGATFVARGFSGDIPGLTKLIVEGIKHSGFAFIDIFQPCVTFNHINTYAWYREHIYSLPEEYKANDRAEAYKKALEMGDKIPVGIFYKEEKPSYEEQLPQLSQNSLLESPMPTPSELAKLLEEFV